MDLTYILWIFEVPNCDNVLVKHIETFLHHVTPKVWALLEHIPVS